MPLSRKELLQLGAVVAIALLVSTLLRAQRLPGENIGNNPVALAVREDRSSPRVDTPEANLTLVMFTDYQCPACRAAHPAMLRAIAKDGKVRLVYKDWPIFGEASQHAAKVAIASDFQHIYPGVHDRLMTGSVGGDLDLRGAVEQAGGDWQQLQSDLALNRTKIEAQLDRNKRQAFQLGLEGTPGYLIGPILVRGALTERQFTRTFHRARE